MITNNSELALQQAMQLPSQTNTEKQGCSQPPESKGQEFAEIMNTLKQQKKRLKCATSKNNRHANAG